ncbi:MAG: spore cortex biosynthesis protein YabQ [Firmicutes bacterium]|jgi:spore cortex biosynthesis protein YabQ|nr:spore cortex biosynthesis protein YabQ [Bacillota bacterium]
METLDIQARVLGVAVLAGVLMGFIYDLFWLARTCTRARGVWTGLSDLTYWLACAAVVFSLLMQVNRGEVRLFVLFGLAIGLGAYRITLRHNVVRGLLSLRRGVARTAHRVGRATRSGGRIIRRSISSAQKGFAKLRIIHALFPKFKGRR